MFPCSDWVTPVLQYIPDALGDIEKIKTQQLKVMNGIMIIPSVLGSLVHIPMINWQVRAPCRPTWQ